MTGHLTNAADNVAAIDILRLVSKLPMELSFVSPTLKALTVIRETVETAKNDRKELKALLERCTCLTAKVVDNLKGNRSSQMDVTSLEGGLKHVAVKRCSRRSILKAVWRASIDKNDIAQPNARIDHLAADLGLAGNPMLEAYIREVVDERGQGNLVVRVESAMACVADPTRKSDNQTWQTAWRRTMEAQKGDDGCGLGDIASDNPGSVWRYLIGFGVEFPSEWRYYFSGFGVGFPSEGEADYVLLYGKDPSAECKKSTETVLASLERWSFVRQDRLYTWSVLAEAFVPCPYDKVLDASNAELPKALKIYDMDSRLRAIEDDLSGGFTLHNLGTVTNDMVGREEDAERCLRRALEIKQEKLGLDHPDVANTLHSLGGEARKIEEAEQLFQRTMEIRESMLGPDHPDFAKWYRDVANCKEQAEQLLRQASEIREMKVGGNDPDIANALLSFGVCIRETGKPEEAEELLQQDLICEERPACVFLGGPSVFPLILCMCVVGLFERLNTYVRHSFTRFGHYMGLLGLHVHMSGRTYDERPSVRTSRGKSAPWSNSVLGVIAAGDFVSGVAATESLGERIESTVPVFLRWLCQAHWSVHAMVITLAGMIMYKSIVIAIREFKAGNAEFSAAWRATLQAKHAAISQRQGRFRASR